jgi:hypothetical protein
MRRIQIAALVSIGVILLIITLAVVLRPYLIWLFALFMVCAIFRIAARG